jgi:phosphate-selective porin OprO and OprP
MRRLRSLIVPAILALVPIPPATADDPANVEDLDQRVRILERKAEIAEEDAAKKAKDAPIVSAGKEGFSLKSADGSWQLKLRGYLQFDGRSFTDDDQKPGVDTFVLRRVRPIFEGTVGRIFDFRIMPDFGQGTSVLFDAYLDARFSPKATLRAGKFKPPVGLERLQSATDILFVERGLPTNLVPNRDLGVQLQGEFAQGALTYSLGVFNGAPDGANVDLDTNNSKDAVGRIFVRLKGLGLGVSASSGQNEGTPTATGLAGFRSASQASFFSYRTDSPATAVGTVVGSGDRRRISGQAYYYVGRFGAIGEYVKSSQDVTLDVSSATLDHTAWQVAASLMLTTDKAAFKSVSPKKPFDLAAHTVGAFELAARVGKLSVDDAAFPTFANPASSASEAQAWGVGLNWYLTRNVKFMLDYENTDFTGGAAGGADREPEKIYFSRMQISF